jgi:LAS superfamily LD-carboxypeptidase LdcB
MKGPIEYLVWVAAHNGLNPQITSTYRTWSEQNRLYEAYRTGTSRFPAAPPGQSYHQYGRAADIVLNQDWAYQALGALWKQMGGSWWLSDRIHFQA